MKYLLYILLVIAFYSCDEQPLTPAEEEAADNNAAKVEIDLQMSNTLSLAISVKNFPEPVSIIGFEVVYNPEAISYSNFTAGDYAVTEDFESESSTLGPSFLIVNNISQNGELLTMSFQGSENSYKYTTIYLTNIIMYDNNGNELIWEDFSSSGVCYIDKHPTNDELIFDEFTWRDDFCFPLNYVPSSSGQ
jgi:hypothetical protein